VGEGLSETVGAGENVTIPFSVEPSVGVTSKSATSSGEVRLLRIVRGVLEVETFHKETTTWNVRLKEPAARDLKVLIRHSHASRVHELEQRPEGTEDVDDGYLVPLTVDKGGNRAEMTLVERTPSRTKLSVWEKRSPKLLNTLLEVSDADEDLKKRIAPVLEARQAIGLIDTKVRGLKKQQAELDSRARETRANLKAIKKDPKATSLRSRLNKRLEEFTNEGNAIGRKLVELNRQRLELKIDLDDRLLDFNYEPAKPVTTSGE
jgi:hypothetical protein